MLIQLSVTGNSHVTAVPHITIHVSFGRGRLRRQRSTREGKNIHIPPWALPAQRLMKEANPDLMTEQVR